MLKNNIKWVIRSLNISRTYSLVNIIGLSIGLAGAFFILIYIINETSYDKHQINRENAYRVLSNNHRFNWNQPFSPFILSTTIKNEIPEVKKAASIRRAYNFKIQKDQDFINEEKCYSVEPDILVILTFQFLYGDKQNCLKDLNDIVISDKIAQKYFNTDNAVGKELSAEVFGEKVLFKVKAVFKEYPRLSTITPQLLIHNQYALKKLQKSFKDVDLSKSFTFGYHTVYILLENAHNKKVVEDKINDIIKRNLDKGENITYTIQPIKDFYFYSEDIVNNGLHQGNIANIYLFSLIAILILSIAVINYIILSIARSVTRSKEIGLKRIMGASQKRIIMQMIGESSIIVIIASLIGIPLVKLSVSGVQKFFDTNLEFSLDSSLLYYLSFIGITLLLAIISGLLISRHYSRINPVQAFKNTLTTGSNKSFFRNILIIVQLSIFIGLLSSMLIIKNQIHYAIHTDPGFNKDNLLFLSLEESVHYAAIKEELSKHPAVLQISGAQLMPPTGSKQIFELISPDDPTIKVVVEGLAVDFNFLETMGMKLIDGRDFDPKLITDSTQAVILNETAIKKLSIKNPLNKKIGEKSHIIGIVRDFNFHSFHEKIPPVYISITPMKYAREIVIRYDKGDLENLVGYLNQVWKKFYPDSKPYYAYYEQVTEDMYSEEIQLVNILFVFSSCAIFIALLGLFGLTVFVTERRMKEIGIRKVQGASEVEIIKLFTKGFVAMVVISLIITTPVVIYLMNKWLSRFAYKVPISWWVFIISAFIALIFVLTITTIKTFRVARVNPVDTLRYE